MQIITFISTQKDEQCRNEVKRKKWNFINLYVFMMSKMISNSTQNNVIEHEVLNLNFKFLVKFDPQNLNSIIQNKLTFWGQISMFKMTFFVHQYIFYPKYLFLNINEVCWPASLFKARFGSKIWPNSNEQCMRSVENIYIFFPASFYVWHFINRFSLQCEF